jgi:hypothetical protein
MASPFFSKDTPFVDVIDALYTVLLQTGYSICQGYDAGVPKLYLVRTETRKPVARIGQIVPEGALWSSEPMSAGNVKVGAAGVELYLPPDGVRIVVMQ